MVVTRSVLGSDCVVLVGLELDVDVVSISRVPVLSVIVTSSSLSPFKLTVADPLAKPLKVAVVIVPRVPRSRSA